METKKRRHGLADQHKAEGEQVRQFWIDEPVEPLRSDSVMRGPIKGNNIRYRITVEGFGENDQPVVPYGTVLISSLTPAEADLVEDRLKKYVEQLKKMAFERSMSVGDVCRSMNRLEGSKI